MCRSVLWCCPAGLSSESWSIMKNMATELCIILIGYFTLVPAIQVRPQGLLLRGCCALLLVYETDLFVCKLVVLQSS